MEYKYELHCHTQNTSKCGRLDAEELVNIYKEAGYSGIVITDHYSPMTFTAEEYFNKKKALKHYLKGYNKAKKLETDDFAVLFGIELRFYGTLNDYLIYGASEEMINELPFLLPKYLRKASKWFRKRGCLVVQAHPFRQLMTRANPKYLDGIEVYNGKANKEANENSKQWAEETGKIKTSGSDCHRESGAALGGIITYEKIKTNEDLVRILKSGNYKLIETEK
ncbi:MAG: PHP domain-containing protein [Acutalibacteraceae bacterium]